MNNQLLEKEKIFNTTRLYSYREIVNGFKNYIEGKKLFNKNKKIFNYHGIALGFTAKQIKILKLIANGFSNLKIAEELGCTETAVKLTTYRLVKYMERILYKNIDRYSLIIIAQELFTEPSVSLRAEGEAILQ